jgi:hypothetical protein
MWSVHGSNPHLYRLCFVNGGWKCDSLGGESVTPIRLWPSGGEPSAAQGGNKTVKSDLHIRSYRLQNWTGIIAKINENNWQSLSINWISKYGGTRTGNFDYLDQSSVGFLFYRCLERKTCQEIEKVASGLFLRRTSFRYHRNRYYARDCGRNSASHSYFDRNNRYFVQGRLCWGNTGGIKPPVFFNSKSDYVTATFRFFSLIETLVT